MINLTPISKRIQNRLFEKMKVLGRESGESIMAPRQVFERGLSPLDLNKLSTRSTFMRMTSGLAEPVMLVGGEPIEGVTESLNIFKNMAAGYDEIYGPRQYISYDPEDNFEIINLQYGETKKEISKFNKNKLNIKAIFAISPKTLYLSSIKNITKRKPITSAKIPASIES